MRFLFLSLLLLAACEGPKPSNQLLPSQGTAPAPTPAAQTIAQRLEGELFALECPSNNNVLSTVDFPTASTLRRMTATFENNGCSGAMIWQNELTYNVTYSNSDWNEADIDLTLASVRETIFDQPLLDHSNSQGDCGQTAAQLGEPYTCDGLMGYGDLGEMSYTVIRGEAHVPANRYLFFGLATGSLDELTPETRSQFAWGSPSMLIYS